MQNTVVKGLGKCPKLPWMIEFHSTADGKILNNQLKAAFAPNFLEHLDGLGAKSGVRKKRLTQFAVVIPPRVPAEDVESFLKAGMTVAVLRLDYFTAEEVRLAVDLIQGVNEEFGRKCGRIYPLAVALEVSEPEIQTGRLEKPLKEVELERGQKVKVMSDPEYAERVTKDRIYVDYENIWKVVQPGDSILIGREIKMSAYEIARDIVECIVERAGMLCDNLNVKLPNIPVLPKYKEENIAKLEEVAENCQIDMIFVGPDFVESAKRILGPTVLIFIKIEYESTVENLDNIVKDVDGVLIDGDKLLSTANENVFIVQKSTIAKCNKLGKPVVSSINCHTLTKATVQDIANTVIDGADALLLPPEPELLESVSLVCKAAEGAIYQKQLFDNLVSLLPPPIEPIVSVAIAAVEASFNSNAAAIILLTTSGRSAKLISRYRPRCPVIALTRFGRIAKQLMIYKAVIPIYYVQKAEDSHAKNVERKMQLGMTFGKIHGYIRTGDAVVIVFGMKNHVGFRNCLEVVFASECDTVPDSNE